MINTGSLGNVRREFVVFKQEETGPRWRGAFDFYGAAEQMARELAAEEKGEFFIFSFKEYREIAKFPARKSKSAAV